MPVNTFSIGEVAMRQGIRPSALRYYESIGVLPAPQRINGRRVYDNQIFLQLALIQYAKTAGFTMAEIKRLVDEMSTLGSLRLRWQQLADQKLAELDARMLQLQTMKQLIEAGLACNCTTATDCVILETSLDDPTNKLQTK